MRLQPQNQSRDLTALVRSGTYVPVPEAVAASMLRRRGTRQLLGAPLVGAPKPGKPGRGI